MSQVPPKVNLAAVCDELRKLGRRRNVYMRSRIKIANRLLSVFATDLGYAPGLPEKERKALYKKANDLIKKLTKDDGPEHEFKQFVRVTQASIKSLEDELEAPVLKDMERLAALTPAAAWCDHPDQRGFNLGFLSIVIGECGDLNNYANPAKLWRRMGCAPWEWNGETRMGASWRAHRLPADEWVSYGYSKRRRSIAYLIGKNIVMQNKGPYRARYDEAKEAIAKAHPDYSKGHCDNHAMLVATKALLRNLWRAWRGLPNRRRMGRDVESKGSLSAG